MFYVIYFVLYLQYSENEIDGPGFFDLTELDIKSMVPKLGIVKKICRLQVSSVSLFQYCFFKTCVDQNFHMVIMHACHNKTKFLIDHDGVVVEIEKAKSWVRTSHLNVHVILWVMFLNAKLIGSLRCIFLVSGHIKHNGSTCLLTSHNMLRGITIYVNPRIFQAIHIFRLSIIPEFISQYT